MTRERRRAQEARDSGLLPIGELAKHLGEGITPHDIRAVIEPSEWHHTSKYYNETNFYSIEEAEENINRILAAKRLRLYFKKKTKKVSLETYRAKISWLEWSGTKRHPKATEYNDVVMATFLPNDWVRITIDDGKTFRKRLTTTGFRITKLYRVVW